MKLKDGFVMQDVAGQTTVIATGKARDDFYGIINLNKTGKFLWQALGEECSEDELVARLVDAYDVSTEQAEKDVAAFLAPLREAGFFVE